jgi:hypothetical protein
MAIQNRRVNAKQCHQNLEFAPKSSLNVAKGKEDAEKREVQKPCKNRKLRGPQNTRNTQKKKF